MSQEDAKTFERCRTFVDFLRLRAERQGDELVYRFLQTGDVRGEILEWTYGDLDFRARSIAAELMAAGAQGERVLLLFPPDLEFVAGFMGCLYAGAIAVPTYPPEPSRLDRTLPRLRLIAEDSRARFILTTTPILSLSSAFLAQAPELAELRWLASDNPQKAAADAFEPPAITGETVAFFQYTSGSTGSPKGVMVSHANIRHNEELIRRGFGHDVTSSAVGWLPLFHDMGLIGNVLQPLYVGFPCTLMSPLDFLRRPLSWLTAISHYRATTSGGPNFAYDLCVRKIKESERAELDLTSWTVAFNGAEPIRSDTLDRFVEAFAPCGFRREAFYPCYGLAEATLLVTGGQKADPPRQRAVDGEALSRGRVEAARRGDASARVLVSSGQAGPDHHVLIVRPETCVECGADEIGEIWVSGASVARGYWGLPEETERTFGGRLSGRGEGLLLRTGDLGFLAEGELFVTGRLKDLIILRGRNLYPQDIEQTVERADPRIRSGCCAAFSVDVDGEEQLAVVAEVEVRGGGLDVAQVIEAIRLAVAEEQAAHAHAVVLLSPRAIPKTSSGKIQRRACQASFLAGSLEAIGESVLAASPSLGAVEAGALAAPRVSLEELRAAKADERPRLLSRLLEREIAEVLRIAPAAIEEDSALLGHGLDSLMAIEVQGRVESALGLTLPSALFWQEPTIRAAASFLAERLDGAEPAEPAQALLCPAALEAGIEDRDELLSSGQLRLWFFDKLAPRSALYTLHFGLRMAGPLDVAALRRSLDKLLARHAILRAVFHEIGGEPRQREAPRSAFDLSEIGLTALPPHRREERLCEIALDLARAPFDLESGPLVRGSLVMLGSDEHALLFAMHHIVTDGWSVEVLARDLAALYRAEAAGSSAALPSLSLTYADYARWQRARIAELDDLRAFWAQKLRGLPRLELPADRPAPRSSSYEGATFAFALSAELTERLRALGRREGSTLFVTLLSAYAALLSRYSGQEDFGVGAVVANRERPLLRDVVGFFANTLVLRCDLSERPTFRELLGRVRRAVAEAFAHAELPFEEIVASAGAARSGEANPLFQASFVFERIPVPPPDIGGMRWAPLLFHLDGSVEGTAKFDLGLVMAEGPKGLAGMIEYRTDRFDAATIARMSGHFEALLAAVAVDPDQRLDSIALLTGEERRRIVEDWNDTSQAFPEDACFHELFEAQVERAPEAVAAVCGGRSLSYRELSQRSERIARRLSELGIGRGAVVALLFHRGIDWLIAVLSVFKAGAAYLPLDPAYPAARLRDVLAQSRAALVIAGADLSASLPVLESGPRVGSLAELEAREIHGPKATLERCTPRDMAYVIYTSGSTGVPKGAVIEHRGMGNHLYAKVRALGLTAADVIAETASPSFDISVWQLLAALLVGGRVHIVADEVARDPRSLLDEVEASEISILEVVPSLLGAMLDALDASPRPALAALRWLLLTGEALAPELCRRWLQHYPAIPIVNAYGPTECSDDVAHHFLRAPPRVEVVHTPIGRPIMNTRLYVLDRVRQPVPIGVAGELYVGGVGVGRGYLHDPIRTSEAFLPDPFASEEGARLYRTGDLARYLPSGEIEFLGRIDHQVKIRGFRIELGEIEAALRRDPSVRDVAVLAREDEPGDKRLVAYVVLDSEAAASKAALRDRLRGELPAHMVPSAFVVLDALPLTPNGKLDRRALPAPDMDGLTREGAIAPRTPVEELIAGVFCEVLGVERVGVFDDFFALGGHSILATQVISRLRVALAVEVPLRELFNAPTVAGLSACVARPVSTASRTMAPPLERATRGAEAPLSFAQQRLWFLDQLDEGSAAYNVPAALRLSGALDVAALRRALAEVVRRHEALRTTFSAHEGRPVQIIHPEDAAWDLPLSDLSGLPERVQGEEIERRAEEGATRPFDLVRGPLFEAELLRLGPTEHVLCSRMHHIVSDGWSLGVLSQEVTALYAAFAEGRPPPLPDLPIQYADFAIWQRRWLSHEAEAMGLAHFRRRLAGAPALVLPTDRPRATAQTFRGAHHPIALSADLVRELERRSRQHGATLFMTLLSALFALLHRYSGQDDLTIGTPISGRDRAELEPLIGFFVNTLVLRADLGGAPTFAELIAQVRAEALSAYAHQDVPFERLVDALGIPRDLSQTPLFQVMFALQNAPMRPLALAGLSVVPLPITSRTAKFDLTLSLGDDEGGLSGALEYNADLFDASTIARMAGHFEALLRGALEAPDRPVDAIPLLAPDERRTLLVTWNDTDSGASQEARLHELFEAQVERTPDAIAVETKDGSLSYRELNRLANRLAHHLRERGATTGALIGICMARSLEMMVGLFAILKAGGAYVPLDPAYPKERLGFLLADASCPLLLGQRGLLSKLPTHDAEVVLFDALGDAAAWPGEENLERRGGPEDAAYIIYTSGSTGRPKGVVIEHRNVVALASWARDAFTAEELGGVLGSTSICFDLSVFELLVPLCWGGRTILVESALLLPLLPPALGVTLVNTVPSAMAALLGMKGLPASVRTVNLAGEPLREALVKELYAIEHVQQVFNLYGPSETTTYSTFSAVARGGRPTIGRPVANTKVYVLDARLAPVPIGVPGELYIGGAGVSRGYLGRPELTAERFLRDPFGSASFARMYKTGDRVRWLASGELDYLGRVDHQVKLRGYRIELGEIEAVLGAHPAVREVVVTVRDDTARGPSLAAYVTARVTEAPQPSDLARYLGERLPEHMIPSAFVVLDALPLTPNGKIDRKALPAPREPQASLAGAIEGHATPVEEILSGIWAEVLGVPSVGARESFFELGGHSLLATQVIARIEPRLGVRLPVRAIFDAPTVAGLSARIAEARRSGAPPERSIQRAPRGSDLPLSSAQERLWFLEQLAPGSPSYIMPAAVRVRGALDAALLERSLTEIVRRHEALRTTFTATEGRPRQVIAPRASIHVPVIDLSELPLGERETEAERRAAEEASCPFNLSEGPLLRAVLLRLDLEEHVFLLTMHHIVSDGWSIGVLLRELSALYAAFAQGAPSPLPELTVQYADYAVWQRQEQKGEARAAGLAHWKQELSGVPAVLELLTDRPRPPVQSFRGAAEPLSLSAEISEGLRALSRREGVTLFMTLLSVVEVLLYRITEQESFIIGSPNAGRAQAETEGLIGFFVNTLPLRADLSGEPTFRELLERAREVTLSAYEHQSIPFEEVVELLSPERDLSRTPLFQVMFTLDSTPLAVKSLAGLSISPILVEETTAKFDLTFLLADTGEGIQGSLVYNTSLFDRSTAARLRRHIEVLIEGVLVAPEQRIAALPLLREGERRELLVTWNDVKAPYPADKPVHALFEAQAERTPEAIAVVFENQQISYRELNRRANQLGHHLRRLGVGPEVIVAVAASRSVEMVVGILGILKAGGAYLPLDPADARERLRFTLEDSGVKLLLTEERLAAALPSNGVRRLYLDGDAAVFAAERDENVASAATPDNIAYVIYTSGSTGRPKGVLVEHRGLSNLCEAQRRTLRVGPGTRVLQFARLCFDAAVWEVFTALVNGGTLCLARREALLPGPDLARLLSSLEVNLALLSPSALSSLPDEPLPALGSLLVGGEACPADLAARWAKGRSLWNAYGPTEATVITTLSACRGDGGRPPIGRPIANASVYVLDARMEPVPIGVPGELYIGGAGVARGYLHRPELSSARFVEDRFSSTEGARMYRTGDRVRWLASGELDYLGRLDHQVKLRGFRIELGEIESVLSAHPAVREAIVTMQDDAARGASLCAYVTARGAADPRPAELLGYLSERLPEYMIPARFMVLNALPLTSSGKVDRRALPEPPHSIDGGEHGGAAPQTPLEELLASLWAEVLGREQVGVHDDFFALGGHSLLATQVIARLRPRFGVELPLRALFEAKTVAALAERIQEARSSVDLPPAPPIERAPREGEALRLSFAQERLWFLDQLEPASSLYNVPAALSLRGKLDREALGASLREIVRRHEALRTTFLVEEGAPYQRVAAEVPFSLLFVDLGALPEAKRRAEIARRAAEEAARPFDLSRGPLLGATLLRLSDEEHVLLLSMHHIVSDGWSLGVLVRELSALYEALLAGRPSPLSELPIQYADFARWQRRWIEQEVRKAELPYWEQQLDGIAPLELPVDRPRPPEQTYRGATCPVALPRELSKELVSLSRRQGVTLFMTLLAAFDVLLSRYSGQDDIAVGTPIAGRTRVETEGLIGFFVNTLVLRTDLSGEPTFEELLDRVRKVTLSAYEHQELPFEQLVDALSPARELARSPLFQVMFVLQNAPLPDLVLGEVKLSPLAVPSTTAKFDLTLALTETEGQIQGDVEYATDLFDAATIERMVGHFQTLLEGIVESPVRRVSELPLLREAEQQELLFAWNKTEVEVPRDLCVHELFEAQVASAPDAVAVVFEGQDVSYRELNRRANQLAHHLRRLRVGPDVLVGICIERSVGMIVSLLGVLKAGGAYVPIDPLSPLARTLSTLKDSGARVLLTEESLASRLSASDAEILCLDGDRQAIEQEPAENPAKSATAEDLAYVIYTSGSTGEPKGVAMPHRPLVNLLFWQLRAAERGKSAQTLQFASLSFDVSFQEIFSTFHAGGALVLVGEDERRDPTRLLARLDELRVDRAFLPPVALQQLAETWAREGRTPRALREIITAGEQLVVTRPIVEFMSALRGAALQNHYGPTETHVVTACSLPHPLALGPASIGRPIDNVRIHILDARREPVPIGVPGELYIGGACLARGYWKSPDLTDLRFIADPRGEAPGERLYKTGDRARYQPDGSIEFLGRLDDQVKIRGFRIELGEIEVVLGKHPAVRDAVVIAREDLPGDKRLVAYVIPNDAEALSTVELRRHLREQLPEYMVPSAFIALAAFPLTRSGKIDRRALPVPERDSRAVAVTQPRTVLELKLVAIWEDVLGVSPIGVTDDFFQAGGHSLLAVRLMNEIKRRLSHDLPLTSIFRSSTIEELAALIRQGRRGERDASGLSLVVPIQPAGALTPFFCVHPVGGNVLCYVELARALGRERPFYGVQSPSSKEPKAPSTIEAMAAAYVAEIQRVQPKGPYLLGGWSMGGVVAFEMARKLEREGERVARVVLIDTYLPSEDDKGSGSEKDQPLFTRFARDLGGLSRGDLESLLGGAERRPEEEQLAHLLKQAKEIGIVPLDATLLEMKVLASVFERNLLAFEGFSPRPAPLSVTLLRAGPTPDLQAEAAVLRRYALSGVTVREIAGDHYSALKQPHVRALAEALHACLDEALPERANSNDHR